MLSQGKELKAIDFAQIIGGPLQAVITAQAASAQLTTDFIKRTAFVQPQSGATTQTNAPRQLQVVEFDFGQLTGNQASGTGDALSIKVPLLTMIPIPFLRVDSMTIQFNVNLQSTSTTQETNTANASTSTSGSENLEFEQTQWQASVSDQNTYQNNQTIDDTYSLEVTVHAVQDQMPAGMQNVLNIFSNVIQQQAAIVQQVMTASISSQLKNLPGANAGSGPAISGGKN